MYDVITRYKRLYTNGLLREMEGLLLQTADAILLTTISIPQDEVEQVIAKKGSESIFYIFIKDNHMEYDSNLESRFTRKTVQDCGDIENYFSMSQELRKFLDINYSEIVLCNQAFFYLGSNEIEFCFAESEKLRNERKCKGTVKNEICTTFDKFRKDAEQIEGISCKLEKRKHGDYFDYYEMLRMKL